MENKGALWLSENLKNKIRQVFEPRYSCVLDDTQVEDIALNLSETIETLLKFKWKNKYGNNNFNSLKK